MLSCLVSTVRTAATILALVLSILGSVPSYAQRWEKVAIPAPYSGGYYLDVFFLPSNQNLGWACDERAGYVVRTVDGGQTWQGVKVDPAKGACHLEYIQFLDPLVGYCSGPCGMYKSVDGGVTWKDIKPVGSPMIWGGWFRNANEGWFTGGGCGYNAFMKTMDGGTTFQMFVDTLEKRSAMADPYWDATMPANTLYAMGSGTLWRSQSDGVNWQVLAYTGTNAPWHEELAMSGNSICVPMGGAKCNNNPGVSEGMRFSPDLGQTWREFNSGESMFGTFLTDATHGWAAGWNESVYYTSNAGQSWQLRNCGLEGANTDDIFFLNSNDGWVVGDGLFRTAPALRTQSDSVLRFREVCPDAAKRDTVMVRNINWFASPWTATITGAGAPNFRIVNAPLSTNIASCVPQPVIVEYRPLSAGAHTATLSIRIEQPETTLVVQLEGDRREPSAYPVDTLLVYTTRVGVQLDRTLSWRSSSAIYAESIESIIRVSGDTTINMTFVPPTVVRTGIALTYITANARDTGWTSARFRVRLGPCTRDTFVTVRVYGVSPIFNSIVNAKVDAKCKALDTIRIPISNTGNAALIIRSMTASNSGPQAFIVLGFVSGRFGAPWTLQVGESDTVLVEYRSQTGNDNVSLIIENDDLTRTRGSKTPWQIALQGRSTRVALSITPRVIDLGSMCTGTVIDKTFSIKNDGTTTATVSLSTSSRQITGLTSGTITMLGGQTRQVRFTYTASRRGPVNDTIALRMQPCDTTEYVLVRGLVEDLALTITPSSVVDSADVNTVISKRFVIRLAAGDSATIRDIRMAPLPFAMITNIPTVPFVLRRNDSAVVTFTWSSSVPIVYVGALEVEAFTTCSTTVSASVRLKAMTTDFDFGPSALTWTQQCAPSKQLDSVYIDVKGGRSITLISAVIRESGRPFRVISPSQVLIKPGSRFWIVVEYLPTVTGLSTATLDLTTDAQGGTFSVPLQGRLNVPKITAQPSIVDFGTVEVCESKTARTVLVSNTGTLSTDVDISIKSPPRGIRVLESRVAVASGDSARVTIEVDPPNLSQGTSRAVVVFTDRVCSAKDSAVVLVTLAAGDRLMISPDPLNLGVLQPNAIATGTVTISNPGLVPRRIVELRVEPPTLPWRIVTSINGQLVDAGASLNTTVEYAPRAIGIHDAQLVLVDGDVCSTSSAITMKGRAQDPTIPPTFTLRMHMDDYSVQPNARVSIPIYWDSDVQDARVDSLTTHIAFNKLNLVVDSITQGTMPDANVRWMLDDDSIHIMLNSTGPDCGRSGVIAILHGEAFSAIPDSTPLAFTRTSIWAKEAVNVIVDDGSLIVDACGPRFLIQLGQQTIFRLLPPLPAREELSISADARIADVVSIEIVNSVGSVVTSFSNMRIAEGASILRFSLDGLASGVYSVRITSGSHGTLTSSVPLVR
ncbi:MAG: choice-of-anchor D domain-containing protein [Candidatus Kapabacteria bacterium]|nr:choice-of-anchor D domain-containing protein [Candidatus Kapabacteria bacterium]